MKQRNVRRARGFNDSIYVNDNTPATVSLYRGFLMSLFSPPASPPPSLSSLLFSLLFFSSYLPAYGSGYKRVLFGSPLLAEVINEISRALVLLPSPHACRKNRQFRSHLFFSDSSKRVILSGYVIPVTIVSFPLLSLSPSLFSFLFPQHSPTSL